MRCRFRVSLACLAFGCWVSPACSNGASDSAIATPAEVSPKEAPPDDASSSKATRAPASRRPGDGERLNPEIAGLGTEPMLAAFPERVGAWTRASSNAHPAGTAGRWADGASASYRHDGREIRVDVTDMIRVSPCTTGTWSAILEESLAAEPGSKRVVLGKHPAILAPGSPDAEIGLWLGNRCQLGLSTTDASGDELVTLGSGLGLDALAVACERRDPAGMLGR